MLRLRKVYYDEQNSFGIYKNGEIINVVLESVERNVEFGYNQEYVNEIPIVDD